MTQSQLAKIWLFLGLILAYYALNAWVVSQGGREVFGTTLVLSTGIAAITTAIPICSILLILTGLIGHLIASREKCRWHRRIPVIGFNTIKTGSTEGKIYQGTMFFFFQILPWAAMVHFWLLLLSADAVALTKNNKPIRPISIWDWSWLGDMKNPASLCEHISDHKDLVCSDSFTLLPGLEPTVFAFLTIVAIASSVRYYFAIFQRCP